MNIVGKSGAVNPVILDALRTREKQPGLAVFAPAIRLAPEADGWLRQFYELAVGQGETGFVAYITTGEGEDTCTMRVTCEPLDEHLLSNTHTGIFLMQSDTWPPKKGEPTP